MQIPNNYNLIYSSTEIQNKCKELGAKITPWCLDVEKQTGQDVLTLPILRGGIFFFTYLATNIQASLEVGPVKTISYIPGENAILRDQVAVNLGTLDVKGRSILVVDDICDSGRTLKVLGEYLKDHGAIEVKTAVLVKRILKEPIFDPEWVGFEYPGEEWFVGFGMEDGTRWRNLPDIYTIGKSS